MGLKKRPEPSLTLLLPSDDMRSQKSTRHQWLTPVILATQETEIRRITIKTSWKKKKKTAGASSSRHYLRKQNSTKQG
jgi:hypothetical protein